jgi:hypothetical protein
MGRVYDGIDERLADWLMAQPVFFVATAPLSAEGHVNLSPKGVERLHVLDAHTVCYVDRTGSGIETIAHLRENGRIAVMCCAFEGPPRIVRLHGRGEVIEAGDTRFESLVRDISSSIPPGARSVIVVHVTRVADSCGYGVPLMQYVDDRQIMDGWAEKKGPDGVTAYRAEKNATSIDGLTGLANNRG